MVWVFLCIPHQECSKRNGERIHYVWYGSQCPRFPGHFLSKKCGIPHKTYGESSCSLLIDAIKWIIPNYPSFGDPNPWLISECSTFHACYSRFSCMFAYFLHQHCHYHGEYADVPAIFRHHPHFWWPPSSCWAALPGPPALEPHHLSGWRGTKNRKPVSFYI